MSSKHKLHSLAWKAPAETSSAFDAFLHGWLEMLDQTLLPTTLKTIDCRTIETIWEGIKALRVRGAPAIGISAAYGVCVGLRNSFTTLMEHAARRVKKVFARLEEAAPYLATSQ